jgi:hypothetical protein
MQQLNFASTAIVAASTGMVLARPEASTLRHNDMYSSPSSPLNSRYSATPSPSEGRSPRMRPRARLTTPNGDSPDETTGWINNSPQKKKASSARSEDETSSPQSIMSPVSSHKKPAKLRRRSTKSPPFFGWRSKSKSPPVEDTASRPVTVNNTEHYHLYDGGARVSRLYNQRQSIASIHSISPNVPRTPLKRIYPPPQKNESPRLISPASLCQNQSCNGSPKEQLLIRTLRKMTSDGNLSPSRQSQHKRNQSVPSFDSERPNTPTPENGWNYGTPLRQNDSPTVWLVSGSNTPHNDTFANKAHRRLEFETQHTRQSSGSSHRRISSQSPPTVPQRCDSLNWDSESDPTYESMKMDQDQGRGKARISSVFDDSDYDKAVIPDFKSPRTAVTILSPEDSEEELDWDDELSLSNGHPNLTRRMPSSKDVEILNIPARSTSLSRSKSVPPNRPDISPECNLKRLSGITFADSINSSS